MHCCSSGVRSGSGMTFDGEVGDGHVTTLTSPGGHWLSNPDISDNF